jgi:hypothetical protein
MERQLPDRLKEALAQFVQKPRPVELEAPVVAGDIRLCEGGGRREFVLCLEGVQTEHQYWHTGTHETMSVPSFAHLNVCLLTNDVDLASDTTPILSPEITGLGFGLLATTVSAAVFPHQLSGRYGHMGTELAVAVKRVTWAGDLGQFHRYPQLLRGLPLAGPMDPAGMNTSCGSPKSCSPWPTSAWGPSLLTLTASPTRKPARAPSAEPVR